mmetsp:Transcript_44225/g.134659  ORF Transcript_44225/g.134659 Transcript_44225/m.134659 type:complete len:699 (-) Transcript_44225:20-2116(-)
MMDQPRYLRPISVGRSRAALLRILTAIFLFGLSANLYSQIPITASTDHVDPDGFALHIASEKTSQVEKLEAEVKLLRARIGEENYAKNADGGEDAKAATIPAVTGQGGGVCSLMSHPAPAASSLWNNHLADIHRSIRHPEDGRYAYHDLTASLLHFLTPIRLQKSISAPPVNYAHVGRVLDVAYKRYWYIRENTQGDMAFKTINDAKAPPPVNILVMGGSVTLGVLCMDNPITGTDLSYTRRRCAWPVRLEAFINRAVKADVVRVQTITMGGTNTESGIKIWKYGLQSDDYPHPDVLINAYSTNDVHVNSVAAAEAKNQSLNDALWDLTQQFIRTAKAGCKPPLLVYFDDYIGNERNEILETTQLSQTIHHLSHYYGTMAVSYANAVRDLVYRGTEEEWFSPHAWYKGRAKKWTRQIHPGMSFHFSAAIVIAYNFLQLASTYCSLHSSQLYGKLDEAQQLQEVSEANWDYGYDSVNGLPGLRNGPVPKGPRPKIDALPPWLDRELTLETITARWNEDAVKTRHVPDQSKCDVKRPCVFSFVSGITPDIGDPKGLTARLEPYLAYNQGWEAQAHNGFKNGWVPTGGLGSKFTLQLKQLRQPVKVLTFMVMKSYGEKWQGSKIRINASFRVDSNSLYAPLAAPMDIKGEHGKKTSETYNHELDVTGTPTGVVPGGDLKIDVKLVGGTTAKIMGLAFCDNV